MKENVLVTAKIPRLFTSYVAPSVLSMVLIGIQGMVDGIFLGNFEDTNAMASVNIASPFMQLSLAATVFTLWEAMIAQLGLSLRPAFVRVFCTRCSRILSHSPLIRARR